MAIRFLTAFFIFLWAAPAHAYLWKKVDEGFYYADVGNIHAFKIDPKQYRFSVLRAKDYNRTTSTAEAFAKNSSAILVVNGGFFSPERKSLGLLAENGTILNPVHSTPWWAVFAVQSKRGSITPHRYFKVNAKTEMALQVGPRLVINGNIPKMKFSIDRRSGIGIQPGGHIIIAVTKNAELSLTAFAETFRKPESEGGFGCTDAINLDGGNSSQIYSHWNGVQVNVSGNSQVTNAVAVFKRDTTGS